MLVLFLKPISKLLGGFKTSKIKEVDVMLRNDYETLDLSKETAKEGELQQLRKKYNLPEQNKTPNPFRLENKGGRADIFKRKHC